MSKGPGSEVPEAGKIIEMIIIIKIIIIIIIIMSYNAMR